MKQRHGYSRLWYHLIFHTKGRSHLIRDRGDEAFLFETMKVKAHEMDSYILEFGAWRDHVHLLVRSVPSVLLADLYKGLKGYTAAQWRNRFPEAPFRWGDSAYSSSVDPDNCERLKQYVRDQWERHENRNALPEYERDDPEE